MGILDALQFGLTGLFLLLDSVVYWLINKLFLLYTALAGEEIIKEVFFQKIIEKVYVIIGVVMLFVVAYSLLKALINPDNLSKDTGKIFTNIIISLVLIGVVPVIFSYARSLQNIIVTENVIGNIILPGNTPDASSQASSMSLSMLSAFLHIPDEVIGDSTNEKFFRNFHATLKDQNDDPVSWGQLKSAINSGKSDDLFFDIGYFAEAVKNGSGEDRNGNVIDGVTYIPLVSTICGAFLCYVLISFCLDLGVRVVKLAFYQLIAPIPIMLRIVPQKKSVFDNWVKASVATYLEVFIRLLIMYIIVYLASSIFYGDALQLKGNVGDFGKIIVVLGLFAFAKQAPKLISDVIGVDSGNIKLGIGGKLRGIFGDSKITGALTGGLGGMWTGMVNHAGVKGALAGLGYGALKGFNKKGLQFNSQRHAVYSDVLDQKGQASIFGGRAFANRMQDKTKDTIKDSYEKKAKSYTEKVENSKEFKNKYDELYREQQAENKKNYNKAFKQFLQYQNQFEKEKQEKLREYQQRYKTEKEQFEREKQEKLKSFSRDLEKAQNNHDIAQMTEIQRQIKSVQDSQYSNINLINQTNAVESSRLQDSKYYTEEVRNLEAEMARYSSVDENMIMKKAQKEIGKSNLRYKANREFVQNRAAAKAAKEWRENNAEEAAIKESIYTNAFKSASEGGSVAGFGGATGGPSTPSSGGSSSSGNSSTKK